MGAKIYKKSLSATLNLNLLVLHFLFMLHISFLDQ